MDEVFDGKGCFHCAVNTRGEIDCKKASDFGIKAAAARHYGGWTAELAVPWEDLKLLPKIGAKTGFVLTRTRPRGDGGGECVSQYPPLGCPEGRQHRVYGQLILGK
jgi:hypothetical protein